ncbi:copper amine oxidase N-terminal domain-containing protein [Pelotomaculum isophthalicicum JI]|uniref:Copper amine oxidase N-terminal domain-containing protein n=1 Tax=Pelotomaculum isophthalicicum JI TaxID=947010 RepID=A0A9X4H2B7_9FIRM|nr:hypothetical protein [Pelotomaculum isophthalicicum]MDF9407173.1 copper amine oxidase N-terminal domain-containing protein [Pelotomaculum isophthalicicum JI]
MRKLSVATIVFLVLISVAALAAADVQDSLVGKVVEGTYPVVLNNSTLAKEAIVIDGTSYLPVRAVAEALKMDVSFENNTVILKSTGAPVVKQGSGQLGGGQQGGPMEDVAQILGITTDELRSELKAGTTLEQIASDKGITLDQLKEQWLANRKTELDNQVSQGKLTAEQAQSVLTRLEDIDLSKLGTEPGMGGNGPSDGSLQMPPSDANYQK